MTNETGITPALTAGEWKGRYLVAGFGHPTAPLVSACIDTGEREGDARFQPWVDTRLEICADDSHYSATLTADETFKLIALANHALPAADPRKVTFEEVKLLADTCEWLDSHVRSLNEPVDRFETPLHALATKLAALLPPK